MVCDPFGGTLTTAIASLRVGRHCISIEKDTDCFNAALERVKRSLPTLKPSAIQISLDTEANADENNNSDRNSISDANLLLKLSDSKHTSSDVLKYTNTAENDENNTNTTTTDGEDVPPTPNYNSNDTEQTSDVGSTDSVVPNPNPIVHKQLQIDIDLRNTKQDKPESTTSTPPTSDATQADMVSSDSDDDVHLSEYQQGKELQADPKTPIETPKTAVTPRKSKRPQSSNKKRPAESEPEADMELPDQIDRQAQKRGWVKLVGGMCQKLKHKFY